MLFPRADVRENSLETWNLISRTCWVFHHIHASDQGFAEMLSHAETIKVCSGYAQPGEIEAFCAHPEDTPQVWSWFVISGWVDGGGSVSTENS